MADPLNTEVTQPSPNTAPMTDAEFLQMEQAAMQSADTSQPPVQAAAPVRDLTPAEADVYEKGYDPYASTQEERSLWLRGAIAVQDAERAVIGFSPTAVAGDATDKFLTETGRTLFDVTNSIGLTNVDTKSKRSWGLDGLGATGPVEDIGGSMLSFVASFAGYNKFLKGAGLAVNGIRWLAAGGLADAFGASPWDAGLADLAKDSSIPGLNDNFLVNYFAMKGNEDDSVWEARFKNAVEGAIEGYVIGKPVEWVAGRLWKFFAHSKEVKEAIEAGDFAKAEVAQEKAVEAGHDVAVATGQPYFDPDKMEWDSGSYYARNPLQSPGNQFYDVKSAPPVDPAFNPVMDGSLTGQTASVEVPNVAVPIYRSLQDAAATLKALNESTAAKDAAAVRLGNEGVPVGQATEGVPGTQQATNMKVYVHPTDQAGGPRMMSGKLPAPTAPRYSAFKPKELPAPEKAPAGSAAAPKAAAGGSGPMGAAVRTITPEAGKAFIKAFREGGEKSLDAFDATFNSARWNTAEDVRRVIGEASDVLRQHGVKVDHKMTQQEIVNLAEQLAVHPNELLASLAQLADDANHLPSVLVATKMMLNSLGRKLLATNEAILSAEAKGLSTAALDEEWAKNASILEAMLPKFTLVRHRVATGNWTGNIVTVDTTTAEEVLRTIRTFGGDMKTGRLVLSRIPREKAVEGVRRVLRHKTWDALVQWRTGALLWKPATHLGNFIGNTLWSPLKPGMRALGSIMRGDGESLDHSLRTITYLNQHISDSWTMMKRAWVEDRGILDPDQGTNEMRQKAFIALAKDGTSDSIKTGLGWVDSATTFPNRMLLAGDEFFKQINYRAELRAEGATTAYKLIQQGKLKEDQFDAWVEDFFKKGFDENGAAVNQKVLQYAREATFTNEPLSNMVKALMAAKREAPGLGIIFPFVRTPANLLSEGLQMFPGANLVSKRWWANVRSDNPLERSEAYGKLAFGSMVGLGVWWAAMNGAITGAAPTDPKLRKTFLDSGRLPYSIYNPQTGRWTQYNRMDPVAMTMGMFADALNATYYDDGVASNMFAATAVHLADNISDKAMLTGIADFMDLIGIGGQGDEDTIAANSERAAGKIAASFIPDVGSLVPDPYQRDTRDTMDQIMARLGVKSGIPPKRDVTGEPLAAKNGYLIATVPNWLSPLAMGPKPNAAFMEDLFRAQMKIQMPARKVGNVNFESFKNKDGQNAYDRYLELTGQVVDPSTGRNLKQALSVLVPELKARYGGNILPQQDTLGPYPSPVTDEVSALIGAYRNEAKKQLFKEYPELYAALQQDAERKSPQRRGEEALKALQQ